VALSRETGTVSQYLIVDLEATCCRDKSIPNQEREIIEIGAVVYDDIAGKTVSEFQRYVRPIRHARLTDFCQQLTGISQKQVDEAYTFPTAFNDFSTWVQSFQNIIFLHWGSYDRKALEADCRFHEIPYTLPPTSLDFKKVFYCEMNIGKRAGLNETLAKVDLRFEGKPHSALSDAKNTSRLLALLLDKHPDAFRKSPASISALPEIEIKMLMADTTCILRPLTPEIEEEASTRFAVKQSIQFICEQRPDGVIIDFSEVSRFNWVNAFPIKIIRGCQHEGIKVPFRLSGMNETISTNLKRQRLETFFQMEPPTS
jgi:inhibitor of KinA sporulation pathway (predicted exonuclease)/anti-anti-sigma regulatory factor